MAITTADIRLYKSETTDGGTIGAEEIVSGVLNNLFSDVSANDAETGTTRYRKFFVKNESAADDANGMTVSLMSFTGGGDWVALFPGTADDTTSNFDNSRIYGVAHATGELDRSTKQIPIEVENGADPTVVFKAGDRIVFADYASRSKITSATIAAVDATTITVNEDVPTDYVLDGSYIGAAIEVGTLAAGSSTAIWVQQNVPPYTQPMVDPADSFSILISFSS